MVFFQVELDKLFAFGNQQLVDGFDQLKRLPLLVRLLLGVDFLFWLNSDFGKKLLRFSTRLSARSMITPVEFWHFVHPRCFRKFQ